MHTVELRRRIQLLRDFEFEMSLLLLLRCLNLLSARVTLKQTLSINTFDMSRLSGCSLFLKCAFARDDSFPRNLIRYPSSSVNWRVPRENRSKFLSAVACFTLECRTFIKLMAFYGYSAFASRSDYQMGDALDGTPSSSCVLKYQKLPLDSSVSLPT